MPNDEVSIEASAIPAVVAATSGQYLRHSASADGDAA
jgi:hypothetical protein